MKRLAMFVAMLAVLAACGGAKTFKGTQLSAIVLQQSDSPAGLAYVQEGSGPQTVDQVANDDAERAKLTQYGFQSAYVTFFANNQAIASLSGQSQTADPAAHVVASIAVVFKTPDGAKKALKLEHESDIKNGTNIKTVSVDKLGDETVAESGTQQNIQFPGYLIYWRQGNALFGVLVAGGPTAAVTLTEATHFAKTMDSRAQKA
jgi:hypothetical protein